MKKKQKHSEDAGIPRVCVGLRWLRGHTTLAEGEKKAPRICWMPFGPLATMTPSRFFLFALQMRRMRATAGVSHRRT